MKLSTRIAVVRVVALVAMAVVTALIMEAVYVTNMSSQASCPLAAPDRIATQTPEGFPPVGSYFIGKDARCNSYGKCVAERVRNSCAPTREERKKEATLVFDALSCGGYDSEHDELQVYPDGTCLFIGICPNECPGR